MKKTSLLLTLFMLMCFSMAKAKVVTVGNNEGSDSGFPTSNFWKYSLSEQIYTVAEIGTSGIITDLAFYHSDEEDEDTRLFEVYLVHTDKDSFSSENDWIQPTAADLVYSGNVHIAIDSWVKITFDTPFNYNGSSNLALIVNDKTGRFTNDSDHIRLQFIKYAVSTNQALRLCNDNSAYGDLSSASSEYFFRTNEKNQLQLTFKDGVGGSEIISISGGETSIDNYLPLRYFYCHSLTQQIYTRSEMGAAQSLNTVSFFNAGGERKRNLDIYLVHTNKTSFSITDTEHNKSNDWIPFSESDKVFSGEVSFYEDEWTTITFNKSFSYDGSSNLALIVDDNTGSYKAGWGCYFSAFGAESQALVVYADQTNFNADGLSGYMGTIRNKKNQVMFNKEEEVKPERPTEILYNVTPYYAIIDWRGKGNKWNFQYKDLNDSEWTTIVVSPYNNYTLSGLVPETEYVVRVQTDYGDGNLSHWLSTVFTTPSAVPSDITAEAAPDFADISWNGYGDSYEVKYRKQPEAVFFDGFENGLDKWTVYTQGEAPDEKGWMTKYSDYAHDGYYLAAAWSYYNGTAYHADNWLVTPQVDLGGTLTFWVRSYSENYPEPFEVLLSTTGNAIEDFTTTLRAKQNAPYDWTEISIDLSAYAGQKGYIAIHHAVYNQYGLYLDDFCVYKGKIENWTSLFTIDKTITINGLQPSTAYDYMIVSRKEGYEDAASKVQSFTTHERNPIPFDITVDAGTTSASISWEGYSDSYEVKYRTSAKVYSFFEGFEGGAMPSGWTTIDADGDGWRWYAPTEAYNEKGLDISSFNIHSGEGLVSSASYVNNVGELYPDNWLITPQVELQGIVSAWLCGQDPSYSEEHFAFYVSTTGTDISDFTQISEEFVATGEYKEYTADLSAYAGQMGYIAVRHFNVSDQYWLNLDDFGIKIDNPDFTEEWQTRVVTGTGVVLNGLTPETTYEYQIIAKKAGEEDAATDILSFTTKPINILVLDSRDYNYDVIGEYAGQVVNVRLDGRTYRKDGSWQTISLPFDLELDGSPLEGADVRTAEFVTRQDDFLIIHCLTPVKKILAGKPYIIKWDGGEDIVNPIFEDVLIDKEDRSFYLYDDKVRFESFYGYFYYEGGTGYYGSYYYVDGTTALANVNTGAELLSFDCYFYFDYDLLSEVTAIGLNVGNMSETIVGISPLLTSPEEEGVYNLAGQRLAKKQKGINITKGRKLLVK